MKYGKWFFYFVVGGCLLSATMVRAEVQTDKSKSPLVKYQPGKTETGVYNSSNYCIALYRPDGKSINGARYFEIGNTHFRQLPADHPEKLDIIFVPISSSDTNASCGNNVDAPSNISRKKVHFNVTAIIIESPKSK
ncbi:hypothetical protein LF934_16680 [Dickeya dadantii]|uniref:hypothetical protein n=1 Tax=Dickeya dadantii TaxID=204038 RepID=UPI001CF57EEE|nr:hypothetical protein [Dickeya dadantii]MCA7014270.1 hypothetical protein [Dickeya dadantii]